MLFLNEWLGVIECKIVNIENTEADWKNLSVRAKEEKKAPHEMLNNLFPGEIG